MDRKLYCTSRQRKRGCDFTGVWESLHYSIILIEHLFKKESYSEVHKQADYLKKISKEFLDLSVSHTLINLQPMMLLLQGTAHTSLSGEHRQPKMLRRLETGLEDVFLIMKNVKKLLKKDKRISTVWLRGSNCQ